MKPPMAYYGGKTTIASRIADLLPEHGHYVEPFAGSLAVLLAKPAARMETVNDIDGDLMTFWRILRDRPTELARVCRATSRADPRRRRSGHIDPRANFGYPIIGWPCGVGSRGECACRAPGLRLERRWSELRATGGKTPRPVRSVGSRGLRFVLAGQPDATTYGSDRAWFRHESHSPVAHSPVGPAVCPMVGLTVGIRQQK